MAVYRCDLCGKIRRCAQKVIEQKEYDFCFRCWRSLSGKGRRLGTAEITLLPARRSNHECIEAESAPEDASGIFGGLKKLN